MKPALAVTVRIDEEPQQQQQDGECHDCGKN
jgi:hypothetical protein